MNPQPTKVRNHGPIELEDLYRERVKIIDELKEQIWRDNKVKMKAWTRVDVVIYLCSSCSKFVVKGVR